MLNPCSDDEVLGDFVLQDEPHTFHIVFGVAPIAQGTKVSQVELFLFPLLDACSSKGNFARHESFATALAFVIK